MYADVNVVLSCLDDRQTEMRCQMDLVSVCGKCVNVGLDAIFV